MTVMTERPDDYKEICNVMQRLRNADDPKGTRVKVEVEKTRPGDNDEDEAMYIATGEQAYRDTCRVIKANEEAVRLENENITLINGEAEAQFIDVHNDIRVYPDWERPGRWAAIRMQEGIITDIKLVDG